MFDDVSGGGGAGGGGGGGVMSRWCRLLGSNGVMREISCLIERNNGGREERC